MALSSNAKSQDININPKIQENKHIDFRIPIIKALGKHIDIDRLLKSPNNHAYMFSISFSFNAKGEIDSIYFSNKMSKYLMEVIKPSSSLSSSLKAIDFKNEFANKIVLLPIVLRKWEDQEICNATEFLGEFSTLWPQFNIEDKSKQIVLLEPFINYYSRVK